VETVLELPGTDVALSELSTMKPESGGRAGMVRQAGPAVTDFSACYARELSSLTWFVMSLGADAHRAADVALSAFAEAFAVWDRIERPTAWLRRVAGRLYYRYLVTRETAVENVPDRPSRRLCRTRDLSRMPRADANARIGTRRVCRLHFERASQG